MKLRFEVDQAEAMRRGVAVKKRLVAIEVDPGALTEGQRDLIANRMDGIDVLKLHYDPVTRAFEKTYYFEGRANDGRSRPVYIQASLPTFDAMMEAIAADQAEAVAPQKGPPLAALKLMTCAYAFFTADPVGESLWQWASLFY
jgi:hypothetical protein